MKYHATARERARMKNESVVPQVVLPPPGFAQPVEQQNPFADCICRAVEVRHDCPVCGPRMSAARLRGEA